MAPDVSNEPREAEMRKLLIGWSTAGLLLFSAVPATAAVIEGTDESEELVGTAHEDVVRAKGGDDTVLGLAGFDRLYGGAGADQMSGGRDRDVVLGGSGADQLQGGGSEDFLFGGSGSDVVRGGEGADETVGGPGNDRLYGGAGADALTDHIITDLDTSAGDDLLIGGTDNDFFGVTGGSDVVRAGPGHDKINTVSDGVRDVFVLGDGFDVVRYYGGNGQDPLDVLRGAERVVLP
jgi:Ca2+-binding RTX toxin-like protein